MTFTRIQDTISISHYTEQETYQHRMNKYAVVSTHYVDKKDVRSMHLLQTALVKAH